MKRYNRLSSIISSTLILILGVVIILEVLNRAIFRGSIPGSNEIVGLCLGLVIFLSFSPTEEKKGHVRLLILISRLPKTLARALNTFVYLIAIATVGFAAWCIGGDAVNSVLVQESLPTAVYLVPIYHAKAIAALGMLMFFIQLTYNAVNYMKFSEEKSGEAE
jgi:TRAP-type C4-dicarboxylate transport system permease small subunit